MYLNFRKTGRGFTIVELMIVIAIIGVLALVLIPTASKLRENAKLAGVDANMRLVQGQAEAIIDSATTQTNTAAALTARLGTMVKNPFDKTIAAVSNETDATGAISFAASKSVIVLHPTDFFATAAAADAYFLSTGASKHSDGANGKGIVVAAVYGADETHVTGIAIYGYDSNGDPYCTNDKAIYVTK